MSLALRKKRNKTYTGILAKIIFYVTHDVVFYLKTSKHKTGFYNTCILNIENILENTETSHSDYLFI